MEAEEDSEEISNSSSPSSRQRKARNRHGRRTFTEAQRRAAWSAAPPVPGRDPERWRLDAFSNPVLRPLHGCLGCFCYEYDHRVPYSLGGETSLENCSILQTRINRLKSNALQGVNIATEQVRQFACEDTSSAVDMDVLEMAVYGDVKRPGLQCRVYSLFEKVSAEMGYVSGRQSGASLGVALSGERRRSGGAETPLPSCVTLRSALQPVPAAPTTARPPPDVPMPPSWLFLPLQS